MRADLKLSPLKDYVPSLLICVMAVGLQIQATFFAHQNYAGLRLNLGDLALPFIGLGILFFLLRGRSLWPRWSVCSMPLIFIGLVGVMTLALWQGYWTNGFLAPWALVNKYAGFLVLLSYLALGGWLATNQCSEKLSFLFVKYFCGFYIFVLLASILALCLETFLPVSLWIGDFAWDGFMANRNAYMVSVIFVLIVMEVYRDVLQSPFPRWYYPLFTTMLPFLALFNASRTLWIVGGGVLLVIFLKNPLSSLRNILPFLILGSVLCFGFVYFSGLSKLGGMNQLSFLMGLVEQGEVRYQGDQKRLIAIEDGLALYNQSNPFLGGGLGSYREFQIEKRGEFIDLIDFTALWFLVETGVLGLSSFAAFFFLCLWVFYQRGFCEEPSLFHRALFFFLIALACVSILHEISYTRFVWFMMGLGLVQVQGRPERK